MHRQMLRCVARLQHPKHQLPCRCQHNPEKWPNRKAAVGILAIVTRWLAPLIRPLSGDALVLATAELEKGVNDGSRLADEVKPDLLWLL